MNLKTFQNTERLFATYLHERILAIVFLSFVCVATVQSQESMPKKLFRVYLDNDLFSYNKQDGGYSNGLRLDLFYQQSRDRKSFFNDIFFIKASHNAINVYSWSIMQVMITSNDISREDWKKGDYPYSGSLFITHALNSIHPEKKYAIKTEWYAGIMGPKAYAGETQTWFHKKIGSGRPMGWHHQMPTTVLVNIGLSIEKFVFSLGNTLEILIGGDLYAGTMFNQLSLQSTIRLGKMTPYLSGYINRFTSPGTFQSYFIIKPQASIVLHNTLLEGSLFHNDLKVDEGSENITKSESESNTLLFAIDYGLVLSYGSVAFSFTFNTNTGLARNQPAKTSGNVSLYFAL
jgi:lipid A 3-O-deacylase